MSAFQQAVRKCDDCDCADRPLAWFGQHIRICAPCREKRLAPAPVGEARP